MVGTDLRIRSAGKSPDAFRTISEVAFELEVPQHVLRFWESKFSQIKPMKRGGGRRYYRPEDVDLLRRIRSFLYDDGYTIKGVQKLLRDNVRKAESPRSGGNMTKVAGSGPPKTNSDTVQAAIEELVHIRTLLIAKRK